ncbi:helix-turn-helix domain-containing protein [Streptomyces sp. NPDC048306]|uniref:helix-turn-helix domain-containing protein n=1 Tax=Streptomyces sp. NPDC048306 TaxID=3154502 RepID=UPI0033E2A5FD
MTAPALTIAEILDLPAVVPLWPTVGRALDQSESTIYQLAKQGRLPFECVRLGRRRYVRTVDLHRFLGVSPRDAGVGPACEAGSAAGNDEEAACEAASPVEQSAPTAK